VKNIWKEMGKNLGNSWKEIINSQGNVCKGMVKYRGNGQNKTIFLTAS
jgi:hypothetical protein